MTLPTRSLALAALLWQTTTAQAADFGPNDMLQMMRAMAFMNQMYNAFNTSNTWDPQANLLGQGSGLGPWSSSSPWGVMPGMGGLAGQGLPFTDPWSARSSQGAWPPGMGTTVARGLDGQWRGTGGELLSLRGGTFRIQGSGQMASGRYMIVGDQFIAYCVQAKKICQFRFERRGNRLALQDPNGQGYLFQRLGR